MQFVGARQEGSGAASWFQVIERAGLRVQLWWSRTDKRPTSPLAVHTPLPAATPSASPARSPAMGRGTALAALHRCSHSAASTKPQHAPIRALIIGSPGSGKGTLSTRLLNVVSSLQYVSAGDVLRQEIKDQTEVGQKADQVIRRGALMPDEIMMKMMSERVKELGPQSSWLLDGFPRTRGQAVMFDGALHDKGQMINLVLHLNVPDDVVLSRILDRWIHQPSGRTYNLRFNPPQVEGKDDVTGEPLSKRSDDDVVRGALCLFVR